MSGLEVQVDAWRRHAGNVAALRDQLVEARQAAARLELGPETFGIIGAELVGPALAPLEQAGRLTVELLDEALGACAGGVDEVADLFEFVDTEVVTRFEAARDAAVRVLVEDVPRLVDHVLVEGGEAVRRLRDRLDDVPLPAPVMSGAAAADLSVRLAS